MASATCSSMTSTSGFLPVHKVAQRRTASRTASRSFSSSPPGLKARVAASVASAMKSSRSSSTGTPNGRISGVAGELAVVADRKRDRDQAAVADPAPLVDRRAIGGEDHVAVEHEPADAHLVDLLRLARREADHVAVLLDHRMRRRRGRAPAGHARRGAALRRGPERRSRAGPICTSGSSSGRPGWPETWTCACFSVTICTPRSDSWFMMRPIATSLPGMIRDEKITVSPSPSFSSCVPPSDAPERGARLALPAGRDDQHLALAAGASLRRS